MSRNSNLARAKLNKNDEYYTLEGDIHKELSRYREQLAGKSVYCNCDKPGESAFWSYLHRNFGVLRLKKLTATYYDPNGAYSMVYEGGTNADISTGVVKKLTGNGDFASEECMQILKECDVVITNPPFSLAKTYVPTLLQSGKQFLIVGELSHAGCVYLFPSIREQKVSFGFHQIHEFRKPDGSLAKFGNAVWYTNMRAQGPHLLLPLSHRYTPEQYPHYDNFDGIDVGKLKDIPMDYEGNMGVPISYLLYHDPSMFEIVGCAGYFGPYGSDALGIQKIGEKWLTKYREQGGTGHYTANMRVLIYYDADGNACSPYKRVIIRRK